MVLGYPRPQPVYTMQLIPKFLMRFLGMPKTMPHTSNRYPMSAIIDECNRTGGKKIV